MRNFIFVFAAALFTLPAHAERDFITRVSTLDCKGEGKSLEMLWDTKIAPLGPIKILVNGKKLNKVVGSEFGHDYTTYKALDDSFSIKVDHETANKQRKFEQEAVLDGKSVKLDCAYASNIRFFRKRPDLNEPAAGGESHASTELPLVKPAAAEEAHEQGSSL